ncbi:hypothetical protein GQ600_7015 [Phytophthora cactorum]|nr:hypothetical protein GQ600_7015 [Phytophthora cactorum]
MVRVLKPFSMVIAAALSLALATADTATVSVLGDATYTIPASRGSICIGDGAYPSGTACPLKGDVASDNCSEGIPSYQYGKCVAPKDAQCVVVSGTTWGCAYPEGEIPVDAETPCESAEQSSSGEAETPYQSAPSASGYGDAEVTYPVEEAYPKEDEITFPYESNYPDKSEAATPCPTEGQAYEDTPCPTLPYNDNTEEGGYPTEATSYPTQPPSYNAGEGGYPTKDTPCPTLPYSYNTEEGGYPTEATAYPTQPPSYNAGESGYPTKDTPCPTLPYSYNAGETEATPYPTQAPSYSTGEGGYPTDATPYPTQPPSYNTGNNGDVIAETPCPTTKLPGGDYHQGGNEYQNGGDYHQAGGDYHKGDEQHYDNGNGEKPAYEHSDGSYHSTEKPSYEHSDSVDTPCSSSKDNEGSYHHGSHQGYEGTHNYDGSDNYEGHHGGNQGYEHGESVDGSHDMRAATLTVAGRATSTPMPAVPSTLRAHRQVFERLRRHSQVDDDSKDKYPSKYLRGSSYGSSEDASGDYQKPGSEGYASVDGEESKAGSEEAGYPPKTRTREATAARDR